MKELSMRKICLLFLAITSSVLCAAQTEIPDFSDEVPGSLTFDLGFNFFSDAADTASLKWFGSRTARITYQYELPILKSGFSFNPGIGIADERYSFEKDISIVNNVGSNRVELISIDSINGQPTDIKKTLLSALYLDIPLELRWHANKNDYQKSFKIAAGVRGGLLLGGKTKIKYADIDNDRKIKSKEDYNLASFRLGWHARIGFGSFTVYYFQNITELFENNRGPIEMDNTIPYQFGLTYEIF